MANTALARAAGLKIGPTGGVVVDNRMATSVDGVFAAGDCTEIPLGVTNVGVQGLTGSHAYAQGKVAGHQRRRRAAARTSPSTSRGAWWPGSG